MLRKAAKTVRILLTGCAFLVFYLGSVLQSVVVYPLLVRLGRRDPLAARHRCREINSAGLRFFVGFMRAMGLIRFDPKALGRQLPGGPYLLVANHPTLIDVVLLLAANPRLVCVVKESLWRGVQFGGLLRCCGHISAGDGSPVSGAAVAQAAMERLREGDPVLIFPEGTRSPPEGIGRFRTGAFAISTQTGVPVVPLVIRCEPRTLMRGVPWYVVPDEPAHIRVEALPAVGDPGRDPRALADRVCALYRGRGVPVPPLSRHTAAPAAA